MTAALVLITKSQVSESLSRNRHWPIKSSRLRRNRLSVVFRSAPPLKRSAMPGWLPIMMIIGAYTLRNVNLTT